MEDVATWVSYGASPRASLGLIAASRALALVRGRDYVLPQDVLDVTADVLRHRLVLTYDALADGVPADHIVKRIVQTVPLPQVAPAAARRRLRAGRAGRPAGAAVRRAAGLAAGRSSRRPVTAPAAVRPAVPAPGLHGREGGRAPTGTAAAGVIRRRRSAGARRPAPPPRTRACCCTRPRRVRDRRRGRGRRRPAAVHRRPGRRAAAPARAHRPPAARRAAAGRPPRAGAGLGQRGRRLAHLPPGRRRPADGLAGHRAHPGAARAGDDRRPRAGDVGGGRPVGEPRLRHRELPEARPGDRRAGRRRPPDRARRQPARRRRHDGGAGRPPPAMPGRLAAERLLR